MEKGSETKMYTAKEVGEMIDMVNTIAIIQILNQIERTPESLIVLKEEWPEIYTHLLQNEKENVIAGLKTNYKETIPAEIRNSLKLNLFS